MKKQQLLDVGKYLFDSTLDLSDYQIFPSSISEFCITIICPCCQKLIFSDATWCDDPRLYRVPTLLYACKYCDIFMASIPWTDFAANKSFQILRRLRFGSKHHSKDYFVLFSEIIFETSTPDMLIDIHLSDFINRFRNNIKHLQRMRKDLI